MTPFSKRQKRFYRVSGGVKLTLLQQVLAMFAAGDEGGATDFRDFRGLWQDSAGTTPVTAADQPVGKLVLQGGSELAFTQPTDGKRPMLRTDGGRWSLEADGTDDFLRTTFGADWAQPYTIAAAFQKAAGTGMNVWNGVEAGKEAYFAAVGASWEAFAGSSRSVAPITTDPARAIVVYNGASSVVWFDGGVVSLAGTLGSDVLSGITLFANRINSTLLDGTLSAFFAIDRALTTAELAALDAWLAQEQGA